MDEVEEWVNRVVGNSARREEFLAGGAILRIDDVRFLPPVVRPSQIVCIGNAYRDHIVNYAATLGISPDDVEVPPSVKVSFFKTASSIIGHREEISFPAHSNAWDYEGELAIVMGQRCHRVSREDALDYVFGYTIMNDVSIRDVSDTLGGLRSPPAKGTSTFAPLGPWITTSSTEQFDPDRLALRTFVNGELRQAADTSELLWPIAEIVAATSQTVQLVPGDIIATGSPAGTGIEDERYLVQGDVVRIEIDQVGTLENTVGAPFEIRY